MHLLEISNNHFEQRKNQQEERQLLAVATIVCTDICLNKNVQREQ